MPKLTVKEMEQFHVQQDMLTNFENYCGACDNFDTEDCPFRGKVDEDTYWRELPCDKFWD